jgi:mannose-6-phosphate isomerase-like protein (cupin superfamily)
MSVTSINLQQKLALFSDTWRPKVIAELNDYQLKLVKLSGEFVWHSHEHTDELFICLDGGFDIQFHDHTVHVEQGEVCVVPKGIEHRPIAHSECHVMVIEPRGVVNTGGAASDSTIAASDSTAAASDLTAPNDEWI